MSPAAERGRVHEYQSRGPAWWLLEFLWALPVTGDDAWAGHGWPPGPQGTHSPCPVRAIPRSSYSSPPRPPPGFFEELLCPWMIFRVIRCLSRSRSSGEWAAAGCQPARRSPGNDRFRRLCASRRCFPSGPSALTSPVPADAGSAHSPPRGHLECRKPPPGSWVMQRLGQRSPGGEPGIRPGRGPC